MVIRRFPDPRNSSPEGIVAFGGDLEPESLILAYSQGIFPWPIENLPLPWFCPPERAILDFNHIHIPRSLLRAKKKLHLKFTIDTCFKEVINQCSLVPRSNQSGTWITDELKDAYLKLFQLGIAHSFEAWSEGLLVAGIYGVDAGGAFAGESMFHKLPNTSKLVLLSMCEYLKSRGLDWIDIQTMTPHMEALGAQLISRHTFLEKLKLTQSKNLKLF